MPTKPNKVQAAGVAVFADGAILNRLQSVTADTDLGVEEIREISNSSVVEFVEGTPTVSIQMEANQIGARHNIAGLSGQDGAIQAGMITAGAGGASAGRTFEISHFSFDGTQTDLIIQIEEDSLLQRSIYMPDCFTTALSWNFDVGGVATESYSLESDDKRMYVGAQADLCIVSGYYTGDGSTGILGSGIEIVPHPNMTTAGYWDDEMEFNTNDGSFTPLEISVNGSIVTDPASGNTVTPVAPITTDGYVLVPDQFASQIKAGRIRVLGYRDDYSPTASNITMGTTLNTGDFANLGGVRKGMMEIFLISGAPWMYEGRTTDPEELLRLQTCSIDVDLSREALEELGNHEAYERSLNFPISATVNFSALASDIQAWAGFADQRSQYDADTITKIGFRDFVQRAGVLIKIYNDDEESFSVDAGGNAVQEYSCNADNFVIS
jgi:hypothetical protein